MTDHEFEEHESSAQPGPAAGRVRPLVDRSVDPLPDPPADPPVDPPADPLADPLVDSPVDPLADSGDGVAASTTAGPVAGGWRELRVVRRTGSTNADLAAAADEGEPEGLVLLAEHQDAGRGRLDRAWSAPPGSGLTVSVLLRPGVPPARLGWLPLLTGLAAAEAVAETTGIAARLKWPNDVMVGERKLGGVLAEVRPVAPGAWRQPSAVIVGLGLNVTLRADELPVPTATSLAIEGATSTDRDQVLAVFLDALAGRYRAWLDADGDADACGLRSAYTVRCATVGRQVRVALPGGELLGEAIGIDVDGRLRVCAADGTVHEIGAGDVVHVR